MGGEDRGRRASGPRSRFASAAVTLCAPTKRRHTLRWTRSTMSIRAAVNTLPSSIFLNTCPLISAKLFDTRTKSIAFVCELIATLRVVACASMMNACAVVTAAVSAASKASWSAACGRELTDALDDALPGPRSPPAAVCTTMYTEFWSASRTWQLNAQQSLSKHSRTLHAR